VHAQAASGARAYLPLLLVPPSSGAMKTACGLLMLACSYCAALLLPAPVGAGGPLRVQEVSLQAFSDDTNSGLPERQDFICGALQELSVEGLRADVEALSTEFTTRCTPVCARGHALA
jgi:hypothetical protein